MSGDNVINPASPSMPQISFFLTDPTVRQRCCLEQLCVNLAKSYMLGLSILEARYQMLCSDEVPSYKIDKLQTRRGHWLYETTQQFSAYGQSHDDRQFFPLHVGFSGSCITCNDCKAGAYPHCGTASVEETDGCIVDHILVNGERFPAVARYGGRSLYPALLIPAPVEEVAKIHAADDVLPVATRAETAGGLKIQIPPQGDDTLDNPVEHSRTTHTGPWRRLHTREHPVNGTCVMAGHIVGLVSSAFPNFKVKPQYLNLSGSSLFYKPRHVIGVAAYLCENRRAIVVVVSLSDRIPGSLLPPVVIVSTVLNKK
ncbi:hypothetical protein KCU62_g345, partial [Aureobasidium sp. EXF-3399]